MAKMDNHFLEFSLFLFIPEFKFRSWSVVNGFIFFWLIVAVTVPFLPLVDPDKPIRRYTKKELHDFLRHEPIRMKIAGINMTYEGLIPRIQKSMLSKDKEAMQPHIREFVDRAVTFTACPECAGTRLTEAARSSRIKGINIAEACAMQISDLAEWVDGIDEPSVAPLLGALSQTLDSFVEIGLGYLSLDRPAGTLSGGEAQRTKGIKKKKRLKRNLKKKELKRT